MSVVLLSPRALMIPPHDGAGCRLPPLPSLAITAPACWLSLANPARQHLVIPLGGRLTPAGRSWGRRIAPGIHMLRAYSFLVRPRAGHCRSWPRINAERQRARADSKVQREAGPARTASRPMGMFEPVEFGDLKLPDFSTLGGLPDLSSVIG